MALGCNKKKDIGPWDNFGAFSCYGIFELWLVNKLQCLNQRLISYCFREAFFWDYEEGYGFVLTISFNYMLDEPFSNMVYLCFKINLFLSIYQYIVALPFITVNISCTITMPKEQRESKSLTFNCEVHDSITK